MLAEKDQHRLIEDVHIAERWFLRRLTLVVNDVVGQIPVLPTTLQQTEWQVDILAIHKEILVENTHLIEGFTTQEAECATDDFYFRGFIPREIAHIVFSVAAAIRKTAAKSGHLVEGHKRWGNASAALHGRSAVFGVHLHAEGSRIGMFIHESNAAGNGGLCHHGVGIQQQHILPLTLLNGDIISARET